jgi:hypothetical protein
MTLGKKDAVFSMAARNQETASNINATSPGMDSFTRGLTADQQRVIEARGPAATQASPVQYAQLSPLP